MRLLFYTIISITFCSTLIAQNANKAIIVLNSGSILEGQIIEWDDDRELVLLCNGITESITINHKDIQKIIPTGEMDEALLNEKALRVKNIANIKNYNFKHTGLYATAKGHFITANVGNRANGVNGFGLSLSLIHISEPTRPY